jgi:ketosteroid isomerase-like protein
MKKYFLLFSLSLPLAAWSANPETLPAHARHPAATTAATVPATTVGEQFLEALVKKDAAKFASLLAADVKILGNTAKERMSGKDSVATLFAGTMKRTGAFQATPMTKAGDGNLVYYSGTYSQVLLPSATYKQGAVDAGTYLLIARKDSKNEWKVCYLHYAATPLQLNK